MPHYFKNFPLTSYNFQDDPNSRTLVIDIFRNIRADIQIDDAMAYTLYEIQENERPDQISQMFYDTPEYYWTLFIINEHLYEGLHAWPKEYNELQEIIAQKYTKTFITGYRESGMTGTNHFVLDQEWVVGEQIVGNNSGHTATISEIDTFMNRLEITNATGDFSNDTQINGQTSGGRWVRTVVYDFSVEDQINAAHHYEDINGMEIPRTLYSKGETEVFEVTHREYEERLNDSKQQIKVLKRGFVEDFARAYKKLINQ
jgi:hypothetical protein